MSREGQSSTHNLFKKRLKSSYAIGSNSTQIVQNLRVTNKCLSLRLGTMREDLQQAQKHNVELSKQNKKLKKDIQELKQNPMLERFMEVKDHVDNLKNKMYILSSVASGAAETIVELSQMCSSGKPLETSSNMTTACSVLDASGDVSLTDATCSVSADSESTPKKAFLDVIKHKRAHKEKHPLQTHRKQKVCPHSSEDDTAANPDCTESWSFCNVVASLSPSSACYCENRHVNYPEKRREPETKATAQFETRKNTESAHSAQKDQMLEAWVAASRFHTKGTTRDNETPFFKSPNSGSGDKPQNICNVERVSQNSPGTAEVGKSPATTLNQQKRIGHQQENRPKSRSPPSRKEESPVTIPFAGNVKSSKSVQKPTASGFKKRPLSFHKIKLKKCDGLNNTANQRLNIKHWGLSSSSVCNKDKNNIESGFSKTTVSKAGGQESAAKATFLTAVSTRISKSPQKLKKGPLKIYKNGLNVFPKTKLKSRQQKLAEQFPVFLNAEKQRLGNVLSMPADESTFPIPSFKNTNETLSTKYETFTVDRLSNINLCSFSNKLDQLEQSPVHCKMLKDISPSIEEGVQSKRHAHQTKLNDSEYSTEENSQDVFDEENSSAPTLTCPSCNKADYQQHGDNVFQKSCLGRSGDDAKQHELSVETSNDYSNKWSTKNIGVSSTDLCKYNEFKNADTNIGRSENYKRNSVNYTLPNQQNLGSGAQKKVNIPGERRDQNVIIDTHNKRRSNYCYTRPHSAILKTERSGECRDITRDGNVVCYSNAGKIDTLPKSVKRRSHSVASNRSKTNIFKSETKLKKLSSNIKSHFVPINVACKDVDQINASRKGTKRHHNILSPFTPISETSQDSSVKCKLNLRRILHSRTDRSMSPGILSKSVASNEKVQLNHLAWTNCNAAVEFRETTAGKTASEESGSNKTLQAETSQDGQTSNDVSAYKSCNTEMLIETHTDSLVENWPPSVSNQEST